MVVILKIKTCFLLTLAHSLSHLEVMKEMILRHLTEIPRVSLKQKNFFQNSTIPLVLFYSTLDPHKFHINFVIWIYVLP